jgi:hypothetical protein
MLLCQDIYVKNADISLNFSASKIQSFLDFLKVNLGQ